MTGVPSRATAPAAVGFAGRTRHHIALRLLPFVFLLYVTNYVDCTSVACAAIGTARDLGFDDRVFGLGIGIFFLSYVALQIPGAMRAELQVGLFGALPYVVALFAMLFNGWHSYKGRERRWHAAAPLVIAATDHCASSVCPARM